MKIFSSKLLILGVLVVTFLVYRPLLFSFFQQDEWQLFGYLYVLNNQPDKLLQFLLGPAGAHYVPFTHIVTYIGFLLFEMQYFLYALLSIFLHLANVFVVILLTFVLTRKNSISLLAGLIFGVSASTQQATTWVVANISVQCATLLGLLSLVMAIVYIENKKRKFLVISIVTFVASLLFKEITIALVVLIPLLMYVIKSHSEIKTRFLTVPFFVIGLSYVSARFLLLNMAQFSGSSTHFWLTPASLVGNFFTFPFKTLSQTVLPQQMYFDVKKLFAFVEVPFIPKYQTTVFDLWYESRFLEALFIAIGVLTFFLVYKLIKNRKLNKFTKIIVWSLLFVGLNSLIYIISPQRTGVITIIDSRNLYFPMVGTSIVVAILLSRVTITVTRKNILITALVLLNILYARTELMKLVHWGEMRSSILRQIKFNYPDIQATSVFFVTSDQAYFGLPEDTKIVPFQSGFGQTLLVWYYPTEKFPVQFLQNEFLWDIKSQGYKEIDDRGFGYYRDINLLKESLQNNEFPVESVIAFHWTGVNKLLVDKTEEIRRELTK